MKLPAKKLENNQLEVTGNKLQLERFFKSDFFVVSNSRDEQRNLLQNRTMHGDFLALSSYTGWEPGEIKLATKNFIEEKYPSENFFPVVTMTDPLTGAVCEYKKGTKDLGKRKFAQFVDLYRKEWEELFIEKSMGSIRWYENENLRTEF